MKSKKSIKSLPASLFQREERKLFPSLEKRGVPIRGMGRGDFFQLMHKNNIFMLQGEYI
jgi:hypothetical protein